MPKESLELKKGSKQQKRGAKGERRAVLYLRLHGYRILERNYLSGHKEIDIIAEKGSVLAFIEVKARQNNALPAYRSVTRAKKGNIISASKLYLAKKGVRDRIIRYDVIEVDLGKRFYFNSVNHIENAFIAR
jgi:Predicted endonuclease distantly related to archaeal Holliday junction resolvase